MITNCSILRNASKCLVILAVSFALLGSKARCQDTIHKTFCIYTNQPNDVGSFKFDGDGHLYDVSYEATNGVQIVPGSPTTTRGTEFYVHAETPGTYTVKVTYNCVDPNCHDQNFTYFVFDVINCDPLKSLEWSFIDGNGFRVGPDISTVMIPDPKRVYKDPVTSNLIPAPTLVAANKTSMLFEPAEDISGYPWHMSDRIIGGSNKSVIGYVFKNKKYIAAFDDGAIFSFPTSDFNSIEIFDGTLIGHLTQPIEPGSIFEGDDLYLVGSTTVSVSRDGGKTWNIDTAGIGQTYIYGSTLDTSQNVYIATSAGIMKQTAKGSTWNLLTGALQRYTGSIFCTGHDVLYASTYYGIMKSSDEGVSWLSDSAGLGVRAQFIALSEDALGNVYAINRNLATTTLFKHTPTGIGWQNIQSGLAPYIADSTARYILHSVAADSYVFLATTFGVFRSKDQGTTWQPYNNSLSSLQNFYGLVRDKSGNFIVSTNLGILRGHPNDTNSVKLFPPKGYANASPIFIDNSGALYGVNGYQKEPIRSTNGGANWNIDTAGLGSLGQNLYYVDEFGTQYDLSPVLPITVFTKHVGASWKEDDAGLTALKGTAGGVLAIQSDGIGNVYLTTAVDGLGGVWKRPASGGPWVADSNGLHGNGIYIFARDKNGTLYGGTYGNGLLVQKSGVWQSVPPPSGVDPSYSVFALSVDSSNTLLAIYGYFDANFNYNLGKLAYKRSGATTWITAKPQANNCTALISYGDTTYLLTDQGLMSFRSIATGSVDNREALPSFSVTAQPNPSNGSLSVSFMSEESGKFVLDISDVLGRTVLSRSGIAASLEYQSIKFDLSQLAQGSYIIRLQQGGRVGSTRVICTH